ncbi:deleted in malignant brain tumors 1 protein-like [Pomacea canaliculata]|uniref:deleted in malignant brain tumors 1 protein-like n=1 Tax=Pomacea canaliculata TaxID=400727 RepID=UPI000D7359A8|nr:deleted in malignant brain tumors 1 protein-like [Pomacea canaliculata]
MSATKFGLNYDDIISLLSGAVCSGGPSRLKSEVGRVGILMSPNYPSNYNNNTSCSRVIQADYKYVIKVTVLNASMEPCCDYVQMFDGMSCTSSVPTLGWFYMPSNPFYSTGYYMCIRFVSDGSVTSSGFLLTYESVYIPVCSVSSPALSALVGNIRYLTSPNYPNNYYKYVFLKN